MKSELTGADFDENGFYLGRLTNFCGDLIIDVGRPVNFKRFIKVEGDCSIFSSASFLGGVETFGSLYCSSSLTVKGQLHCRSVLEVTNSVIVDGRCKVGGDFEATQAHVGGDLCIGGSLRLSSGISCGGSVQLSNTMNEVFGQRLHPVFPIQSIDYAKIDNSDRYRRLSIFFFEEKRKALLVPFDAEIGVVSSLENLHENYPGVDEFVRALSKMVYGESDDGD